MSDAWDSPLETLSESGEVPSSVLGNPEQCHNTVRQLVDNDQVRSRKRAKVKGIVDGNPPYQNSKLKEAGRPESCNVNWRISESYLNAALTAFYDIVSESPTFTTVQLRGSNASESKRISDIATRHFDWLQRQDETWDFNLQISQYEMVLFGCGPMLFQDEYDWRPRAVACGDLKVLERTRSDTSYWPMAAVYVTYRPDELYGFISNPKAASEVGWNVEATRDAIKRAHPKFQDGGVHLDWEWHQQQLKNGAFNYSREAKSVFVAHVFGREFPRDGSPEGMITHKIVLADSLGEAKASYLFDRPCRFKSWSSVIHPMYYDHGGGGYHHSVTGMGVKMYCAMEFQNRLLCNLADKAFAPKVLFKPTTANDKQKFSLMNMGDFAVVPASFDVMQTGVAGFMNDGLAFNRELGGVISSNLSQYRQNLQNQKGNPVTASEIDFRASEQAKLGKTQLNRYYAQMDGLFLEKYMRACNPKLTVFNPGGRLALEFQRRCEKDGVPLAALRQVEFVRATRVIGQGSIYLRQQSLEFLLGMVTMLPESGRDNLVSDVIASRAGQIFVDRYYPVSAESKRPTDQNAFATSQVADMKVGVMPVATDTQNPVIYAQTFLGAGSAAVQSLQQGANPMEVYGFLQLCGPAIAVHLEKLRQDPTRKPVYEVLDGQFQQLAKITDGLSKMLSEMAEAQDEQAQAAASAQAKAQSIQNGTDPAVMIKAAETMAKIRMQQQKTDAAIAMKAQKQQQSMALSDASTAAKITRENQPV